MESTAYFTCKPALQTVGISLMCCKLRRPVMYMHDVCAMIRKYLRRACVLGWLFHGECGGGTGMRGLTENHLFGVSMLTY